MVKVVLALFVSYEPLRWLLSYCTVCLAQCCLEHLGLCFLDYWVRLFRWLPFGTGGRATLASVVKHWHWYTVCIFRWMSILFFINISRKFKKIILLHDFLSSLELVVPSLPSRPMNLRQLQGHLFLCSFRKKPSIHIPDTSELIKDSCVYYLVCLFLNSVFTSLSHLIFLE